MSAAEDVVEVATWNVRNGFGLDGFDAWPFRRHAAADALASLGGDVIGLQEVYGWQLRSLRRALPRHVALGEGRDRRGGGERCTLLVGPSVRVLRHRTLWFSSRPTEPGSTLPGASHPRVATLAELELPGTGRRVVVANAHLDQRREDHRLTGVELLLGWLDPSLPTIVLGDLNAEPATPPLERLEAAGFTNVLPADASGTAHQLTGRTDGPRIDHVLLRGGWEVVEAEVVHHRPGGRLPSDHWPIRSAVRLHPG